MIYSITRFQSLILFLNLILEEEEKSKFKVNLKKQNKHLIFM